MPTITTKDGASIFYKDWGSGKPILFSHGWPLSADDWDAQMVYFGERGYRVIAHDRRGHGRSSQTWEGNDMDTYADDLRTLVEALDLHDVIHVGHSTGGGEVTRYLGRHGTDRASKAVLIGAIPPVMLKKPSNPEGTPIEAFDELRAALRADRAQFYIDLPSGPFYGFNRPGAKVSQGLIQRWWMQGMMGMEKAHYDCIRVFSETDMTEDMKKIDIPVLLLHGEDDQIVPIADAALKGIKLLQKGELKTYPGLPHGMASTHPEVINPEILRFIEFGGAATEAKSFAGFKDADDGEPLAGLSDRPASEGVSPTA
jgi:non-heme chloroperoxidase